MDISYLRPEDWPTPQHHELVEYAQAYLEEFNRRAAELSSLGHPASLFAKRLGSAAVYFLRDGAAAILYLDERGASQAKVPSRSYAVDARDEELGHFLQSGTANCLKEIEVALGEVVRHDLLRVPPDLPIAELKGGLSPEYLGPFVAAGGGANVTGLAIAPRVYVESGVVRRIDPTRARVFSPFLPVPPDGREVLQYVFPFADVLWQFEQLGLTPEVAVQHVAADIEVLSIGMAWRIPSKQLTEDPFEAVATLCERACDSFAALLDSDDVNERDVQEFLEVPGNQFLIAPHCKALYPHQSIGGNRFIPDFVIQRSDGDYHLIEIESPRAQIYQAQGQEPTAPFTHAIQQVEGKRPATPS